MRCPKGVVGRERLPEARRIDTPFWERSPVTVQSGDGGRRVEISRSELQGNEEPHHTPQDLLRTFASLCLDVDAGRRAEFGDHQSSSPPPSASRHRSPYLKTCTIIAYLLPPRFLGRSVAQMHAVPGKSRATRRGDEVRSPPAPKSWRELGWRDVLERPIEEKGARGGFERANCDRSEGGRAGTLIGLGGR